MVTTHAKERLRERWPGLRIESDAEAGAMLQFFVRTGIVLTGRQVAEMLFSRGRFKQASGSGVYSPILEGLIPVDMDAKGWAHLITVFPVHVQPKYRGIVDALKEELVA